MDLKQGEKESILKPFPLVTAKPKQERRQQQQTTTSAPAVNSTQLFMHLRRKVMTHYLLLSYLQAKLITSINVRY